MVREVVVLQGLADKGVLEQHYDNIMGIRTTNLTSLVLPLPQIDIIRAMVIVWRVSGKLLVLFCAVLCATSVHSELHTHMT